MRKSAILVVDQTGQTASNLKGLILLAVILNWLKRDIILLNER